ncbi:SsrA-binding protein SmpB [Candidatus Uhrbacteria bacterium]|nr:SsrA-binding protein SmpB [Candidatus Uhrbacteria bacterium]
MPDFAQNRKARHEYETLQTYEGGLELLGHEVKSIRNGGAKLTGAYLVFRGGELWLTGAHISRYLKAGTLEGHDPDRDRKVLIRRPELESLFGKSQQKGLTLVPFSLYPRGRRIKLSFGLCRGRKTYDKREKLKRRDIDRDVRRQDG